MKNEIRRFRSSVADPVAAAYYVLSVALLAAFILLYRFTPLRPPFNDLWLNSLTTLGALAAALVATSIHRHYREGEAPRRIWLGFMAAGWMWFFGELLWQYSIFRFGGASAPNPADYFWVGGFVGFTYALYCQYALIAPAKTDTILTSILGIWLVGILIPAACLTSDDSFTIGGFIEFFYPLADLAVGIAGLALAFVFRGGALMRPWLGLTLFGLSDLVYAWAAQTRMYSASAENGNLLSLAIDATYLGAYLVLGIGYLGHWLMLRGASQSHKT